MRSKFLFIALILLLVAAFGFSANTDVYYQGTVTPVDIGYTQVGYKWVVTLASDSSNQLHSPAMFIGDCNDADGLVVGITSAASDINVVYHYSIDGYTWFTAVTPADFDALSSTAVQDTIGLEAGTNDAAFSIANWLIVEIDGGSTAANLGEIVTMTFGFTKDLSYTKPDGTRIVIATVRDHKTPGWTNP